MVNLTGIQSFGISPERGPSSYEVRGFLEGGRPITFEFTYAELTEDEQHIFNKTVDTLQAIAGAALTRNPPLKHG